MKIHFLGTACGRPTAHRFNTSMAVEHDEGIFMLDTGEPCTALLKKKDLSPGMVTDIFLSHMHCDHVSGFPMLVRESSKCRKNGEVPIGRDKGVNVYLPESACSGIIKMMELFARSSITEYMNIHPLKSGKQIEKKGFTVIPYANTYPDQIESYAFLICTEDLRILYSGDLPKTLDTIERYLDDLDLLIIEAAHLKPKDIAVGLKDKDIDKVIITHLRWKFHGHEEELLNSIKPYFSQADVSIAYDGMTLEIV